MSFEKGNKQGKGRPKGVKNSKTEEWEKFHHFMMTEGLARFSEEVRKLKGPQLIRVMIEMMEYFQPKLQRTEVGGPNGGPIEIEEKNPKELTTEQKLEYLAKLLGSKF